MRINLVTPFAEKDAVKALGARWDPAMKVWYIKDVADLSPFARWIPDLKVASEGAAGPAAANSGAAKPARPASATPARSKLPMNVPHCGCAVLPWEACAHSSARP
ncbi:MAG TPA: DUF5710 domain-containing protein [Burkholderiaceae bacterium]|nr:DUF5710 domain-containing protein [Burkholderiaceae bacterium]